MDYQRTCVGMAAYLLIFTALAGSGWSLDCQGTAQRFSAGIGPASLPPSSPLHDDSMRICYDGSRHPHHRTCCNHDMELEYAQDAHADFTEVLQSTIAYLKGLMTSHGTQYREDFLHLINMSSNRTETLFRNVYKISHRVSKGPLEALFLDLEAFLREREVNIHETVAQFFDDLFPLVFHNIMNDPSAAFLSEDYHECLTEIREELYPRPFGDVPNRLAHQLSKSLTASQMFLDALTLGIEAMNTTEHINLETDCISALTRLRYCSDCSGNLEARPCRNFCYNVMRGCLATVGEIDRHWNEFVDSLKALSYNMIGYYDVESVMSNLHTRISEAILHAMESGHKFYSQIVEKCGSPRKLENNENPDEFLQAESTEPAEQPPQLDMNTRLQTFMRSLMASKGFYHSLADSMCVADKFATGTDQEQCWNGHHLGRYNSSLVEVDLDSQIRFNPEMTVATSQSSSVINLIDKLIHVKKVITSKISGQMFQSDDSWYRYQNKGRRNRYQNDRDGSGDDGYDPDDRGSYSRRYKGRGRNNGYYNQMDDEDYSVYSGSGSGDDSYQVYKPGYQGHRKYNANPIDPDIYLEDDTPAPPKNRDNANQAPLERPGSSASCTWCHLVTVTMTTMLGLAIWLNG